VIPIQASVVTPLEQCWTAKDISGDVNFTQQEMDKITIKIRKPEEYVNIWQVAGPFSIAGTKELDLFNIKFGPEKNKNYSGWQEIPVGKDGYEAGMINLQKFFGTEQCIAYLKTNVWSQKSQKVLFELGSDDGIKVWLNGKRIHKKNIMRGHTQAEDIVEVYFKKGWNSVLMKITQGIGGWGASLVITDPEGEPIEGLKYK